MKLVIQFTRWSTGERSEAMSGTRGDLAGQLKTIFAHIPQEEADQIGILVLMDGEEEDMHFSQAPLLKLQTFIDLFQHDQEAQDNG